MVLRGTFNSSGKALRSWLQRLHMCSLARTIFTWCQSMSVALRMMWTYSATWEDDCARLFHLNGPQKLKYHPRKSIGQDIPPQECLRGTKFEKHWPNSFFCYHPSNLPKLKTPLHEVCSWIARWGEDILHSLYECLISFVIKNTHRWWVILIFFVPFCCQDLRTEISTKHWWRALFIFIFVPFL